MYVGMYVSMCAYTCEYVSEHACECYMKAYMVCLVHISLCNCVTTISLQTRGKEMKPKIWSTHTHWVDIPTGRSYRPTICGCGHSRREQKHCRHLGLGSTAMRPDLRHAVIAVREGDSACARVCMSLSVYACVVEIVISVSST